MCRGVLLSCDTLYLPFGAAGQSRLLAGTDQGRVVLYDAAELKAEFRLVDVLGKDSSSEADRRSVNATRSGSVVSGAGGGGGTPVTSIVTFSKVMEADGRARCSSGHAPRWWDGVR